MSMGGYTCNSQTTSEGSVTIFLVVFFIAIPGLPHTSTAHLWVHVDDFSVSLVLEQQASSIVSNHLRKRVTTTEYEPIPEYEPTLSMSPSLSMSPLLSMNPPTLEYELTPEYEPSIIMGCH